MQDIESKIKRMSDSVINSVNAEKRRILAEAQAKSENELNSLASRLDGETKEQIEKYRKEISFEHRKAISKVKLDSKHTLVSERNKLTEEIFNSVRKRLVEFCGNKEEYGDYLISRIAQCAEQMGCEKISIFLGEKDAGFSDIVKEKCSMVSDVILDKKINVGGFKAVSQSGNISVDMTFESRLEGERENFAQYCNIEIM